jgi:hypothetical protein
MSSRANSNEKVRIDNHSGYFCLADLYQHIIEGEFISTVWLSKSDTINFIIAWEVLNNPHHEEENFKEIRLNQGRNSFILYPEILIKTGAIGLFLKPGPQLRVYIHPDWAIHFASWISPAFQVKSIQLLRQNNNTLGNLDFKHALVAAFLPPSTEAEE